MMTDPTGTPEDAEGHMARRFERELTLTTEHSDTIRLESYDAATLAEIIAQFVNAEIARAIRARFKGDGG